MSENVFNFPEVIRDESDVITTKELAEILGVTERTVRDTATMLGMESTFRTLPTNGGAQQVRVFTTAQATAIKQELAKHHNLASRQIGVVVVRQAKKEGTETKQELTDKVVTVKELAEELHVAEQTVKNTIYELRQVVGAVFDNIERNSQGGYLLNEKQATAIKLKLRERNNLKDNSIVSQIGNDLEFFALLKKREEEQRMLDAYRDRRIAELQAENEKQAAKIKEDAPKVEFYDAVTDSSDCIDIAQAAKVINADGIGRNKLFEILRKEKILDKNNVPYQKYVDRGYFRIIETSYTTSTGEVKISLKTLVFQKGLEFIAKIIKWQGKK